MHTCVYIYRYIHVYVFIYIYFLDTYIENYKNLFSEGRGRQSFTQKLSVIIAFTYNFIVLINFYY